MNYDRSASAKVLSRCRQCEWCVEIEDDHCPGLYTIDLYYEIVEGEVVLRDTRPAMISVSDGSGRRVYDHEFRESEKSYVWLWFMNRFRQRKESMLAEIETAIDDDIRSRSEADADAFVEMAGCA